MDRKKWIIPLAADKSVSAILTLPPNRKMMRSTGVITAHGAGNDMENPLIVAFSDGLAQAGYPAVRFNFPYKEKGLKTPDRPEVLEDAWAMVCRHFLEHSGVGVAHVVSAGKSMGGRIAAEMAAEKKLPVEGIIFLGYPLHPVGDPSGIRDAHLYRIEVPTLFFAGTRDNLCDLAKLQTVLSRLSAPWELDVIEGGNHSFVLPKAMGPSEADVFARIVKTTVQWLETTLERK